MHNAAVVRCCQPPRCLQGEFHRLAYRNFALPQPLTQSVSGVLEFVAGALLEFSAFGAYSEFGVFDPATRRLTGRPVGWQIASYQPNGVVDGWDDFKGYYQGRTEVTG